MTGAIRCALVAGTSLLIGLAVGLVIGNADTSTATPAALAENAPSAAGTPSPAAVPTLAPTAEPTSTKGERRAAAKHRREVAHRKAVARRRAEAKAAARRAAARTRHRRYLASLTKTYSGNGGQTLAPVTLPRDSKLKWTNDGGYFGIYDDPLDVTVNSSGSHGTTFIERGRHKFQINAVGNWTIKITPVK